MSEMQGTTSANYTVEISIDGEDYTAPSKDMTPDAILGLADRRDAELPRQEARSRADLLTSVKGSTPIKLHEDDAFISVPTGDTTVSLVERRPTISWEQPGTLGYEPELLWGVCCRLSIMALKTVRVSS